MILICINNFIQTIIIFNFIFKFTNILNFTMNFTGLKYNINPV